MLRAIGVEGKALLVDVQPDEKLALSVRNLPGVDFRPSSRITARDVIDTDQGGPDPVGGREAAVRARRLVGETK